MPVRLFPMRFRFRASYFDQIAFSGVNFANRNSLAMRKIGFTVRAEFRANSKINCCSVLWRREETRRMRGTGRRTQAPDPTLSASGLGAPADCSLTTEKLVDRRLRVGRELTSLCPHPNHRSLCCCLLSWITS